jgi:hypothetical protein
MTRSATIFLVLAAACGGEADVAEAPPADAAPKTDTTRAVQADMRNVAFQIDSGITLGIRHLRGALVPVGDTIPPTFDRPASFTITITSADISVDTASLSTLLTRHVCAYKGSPLGGLRIRIEGDELIQKGVLKKGIHLPFSVTSTATLTPEGMIRLHPSKIKVLGIGARGLMSFFGLNLQELAKVKPGHGVQIVDNDFLLDPAAILPPPRVKGRVTAMTLKDGKIYLVFGKAAAADSHRLVRPDTSVANYMYFRGGQLRFGKLTMADADMFIVDQDPGDWFDFNLPLYLDQLVAGSHRTTRANGLIVDMPDRNDIGKKSKPAP